MRYRREDGCRAWITYGMLAPSILKEILDRFGTYEKAYDLFCATSGSAFELYITPQQFSILRTQAKPEAMHAMMRTMQRLDIGVMALGDTAYPESLTQIPDAPALLFYQGELSCLKRRCITMVGSRSASARGIEAARRVAHDLSSNGVCIVSGLAVGIDSASHWGCIEGGSPTIGVAACGLDVDYPAESGKLKKSVLSGGGLLLSECPLGSKALPWHFPIRNRIISGLSSAVLMMEAKIRSGSMTTVQHALDQGREVYAYPGEAGTPYAEGSHQLLREGANYFQSAADILVDMKWQQPHRSENHAAAPPSVKLTSQQQQVLNCIKTGEQSFDQLAEATTLETPALSAALTMLQIHGLIKSLPGKLYCLAEK